jgi:hypothetical protein
MTSKSMKCNILVARMSIVDKKLVPDQLNRTSYLVYSVKAIELFKVCIILYSLMVVYSTIVDHKQGAKK